MPNPSTQANLLETLRQKQQTDRQQIEALTSKELQRLANALKQQSSDALNSTLDDIESSLNQRLSKIQKQIEAQTKPMNQALLKVSKEVQSLQRLTVRAWMRPILITVCLLVSISAGAWGLTRYLSSTIQSQLQRIETQRRALADIEAKTWGVTFREDKNGRFLVLPEGTKPEAGWNVGNRQAVRLGQD